MQQVSALEASGGLPNAIVSFVDLAAPDCAEQIGRQVNIPNVRGIRQIIGRHPDEDHQTGSNELIGNPTWKQGLALLAPAGMSFDLQLIPPQYADVWALLAALPELKVAICHCGSPWDQSTDGLEHWRAGMQRFAELPNVHCKVSGLGMFKHDWEIKDIRPLILDVIEIFGAERVMFGSNFPVDKLYGGYHRIWHAYDEITLELTDEERGKLFFGNAEKFYRI